MAERIDEYTFRRGRPANQPEAYPWEEWADGSCWRITQGVDYRAQTLSMAQMMYRWAKRHGKRVRVQTDVGGEGPDTIVFQFLIE